MAVHGNISGLIGRLHGLGEFIPILEIRVSISFCRYDAYFSY